MVLAILFVLQFVLSISAHDVGISSINLQFSGGKLIVYSSYAKADFEKLALDEDSKKLKTLAKNAFEIKIDGQILKAKEADVFNVFSDGTDGIVFEHFFKDISGSTVQINSLLPPSLSPNHTQILTITRDDGQEISRQFLKGDFEFEFNLNDLKKPSGFGAFLTLGIEHILFGFDHLLFLLALLLVVKTLRDMAGIITFFTIAHSITLSLVSLNIIQLPTVFVEPIIAISIIYVGLENLFKAEPKNRWLIAYAFGLIHGLGFASVLQEIGIGQGMEVLVPLLSFNLGVEVGQIAFALILLPIIWQLRKMDSYKTKILPTASILIVLAGLYWLIERVFY